MPKAEAGSAKALSNQLKARGLTKLRYYCQVCEKANRDEHAYRQHCESEGHMRQIALIKGQGGSKVIDDFSRRFQEEFVALLSRRFGTQRVKANQVYQEYIQERHHLHMNATRWMSLSEFIKHLGREGIAHVEEDDRGWFLSWIDNSPAALSRQAALQKMERAKMDEEGRERKRLREQIEKAQREEQSKGAAREPDGQSSSSTGGTIQKEAVPASAGLQRDSGPIKLGINLKSGASSSGTSSSTINGATAPAATSVPTSTTASASSSHPSSTGQITSIASSSSSPASASAPFKLGINPLKSTSSSSSSSKKTPSAVLSSSSNPLKKGPTSSSSAAHTRGGALPPQQPPSSMTMAEKIMHEEEERKKRKGGAVFGSISSNSDGKRSSGPVPAAHRSSGSGSGGAGGGADGQVKRIRM